MSRAILTPRIAIECVDQAILLGKRQFWPLLRLGLIPFLAYFGIADHYTSRGAPLPVRILALVVAYGLFAVTEALTVKGAWDLLHGRSIEVGLTWQLIRKQASSVVLASLLRITLIYIGLILLVIPGLYFAAIFFAVPTVNVIEGLGVRASLSRSRSLALDSSLGILSSTVMIWLGVAVIALLIPRALVHFGIPSQSVLGTLCRMIWAALVIPFRSTVAARVYLEIRVRKEGYDLQRLLTSLPSAA